VRKHPNQTTWRGLSKGQGWGCGGQILSSPDRDF